jgi:hypothetical protein
MKSYQTVCLTLFSLLAIAFPAVAQTDINTTCTQRSQQNSINLGTNNRSLLENEQISIENIDGTSVGSGSTSVTGCTNQGNSQGSANIGNDNINVIRNRTFGGQDLDASSFGNFFRP